MGAAELLGARVRAPLGQGRLQLPTSSRGDARAGLSLLNPNRRAAVAAARIYSTWITLAGPRLAGTAVHGVPDILRHGGDDLLHQVQQSIGPFTGSAIIAPRQSDRPRMAMLALRDGVPIAFIKFNEDPEALMRERLVLDRLASGGVNIRTPRVIGDGVAGAVHWIACSAMSSPWTRPVAELPNGWRAGAEFTALAGLLGPAPSSDAVVLHGDLAPWNLRLCAGEPWLLDWEDICWGPPGADEAYFHCTATVVCGAELRPASQDAVDFWTAIVSCRTGEGADQKLSDQLLETLRRMASAR